VVGGTSPPAIPCDRIIPMPMSLGAVGFIDALGFKGIWRKSDPDEVAETLKAGRHAAQSMREWMETAAIEHVTQAAGEFPTVSAVAFSDSFLVAVLVPKADVRERALAGAVGVVACGLSHIVRTAALGRVPLTFRGVITTGDCIIDPDHQVFIGPAVDEAGELMDLANGAFTWLAPSAAGLDYSVWEDGYWHDLFADYRVPLKNGSSIQTKVVNPFAGLSPQVKEFGEIRRNHRKAMESTSIDVEVKRQNTEELFEHLERVSREYFEKASLAEDLRIAYISQTRR